MPWLDAKNERQTGTGRAYTDVVDAKNKGLCPNADRRLSTKLRRLRMVSRALASVIRKDEPASEVGKRGKGRESPIVGQAGGDPRHAHTRAT